MKAQRKSFFDGWLLAHESISDVNGYDAVGNLREYTVIDGGGALNFSHEYDDLYRLTSESGVETHTYSYDSVGNRLSLDNGAFTYEHNDLNELTQDTGSGL